MPSAYIWALANPADLKEAEREIARLVQQTLRMPPKRDRPGIRSAREAARAGDRHQRPRAGDVGVKDGSGTRFRRDNIHWWGSRGAGKEMISAPGAFHVPNQTVGVTQFVFDSSGHGTVFLHGIFFAHDAERSKFFAVGTTKGEHSPTSAASIRKAAQWFRTAD